jgi:hypothetical protein
MGGIFILRDAFELGNGPRILIEGGAVRGLRSSRGVIQSYEGTLILLLMAEFVKKTMALLILIIKRE